MFTMLKITLRNLFSKPATRAYPLGPKVFIPGTRGSLQIDQPQCIYCGLCQRSCPTHALEVNRQEKSWKIERLRCIICGACVPVCPKKCLRLECAYIKPTRRRMPKTEAAGNA